MKKNINWVNLLHFYNAHEFALSTAHIFIFFDDIFAHILLYIVICLRENEHIFEWNARRRRNQNQIYPPELLNYPS